MRPLSQIYIYVLITLTAALTQKDNDEGRPYEFGFTIDGQQHRHEKKDQKGIVQGEFGFITADGVYHVTVYATDENGNFKILSMRNIRISAPLDGSPALGPISPDAGKYLSKQNQLEYPKATPAAQPPQIQVTQSTQLLQTVTQRPGSYAFTTLPTIKPACGGCGYVTTQKPLSKDIFSFQNPAFKETPNTNSNSGFNSPQVTVGGSTLPQINLGVFKSSSSAPQIDQQTTGYRNEPAVISNLPPLGPQQLADEKTYGPYPQSPTGSSNERINPPVDALLPPGINNQNQERFFDRPTQFNLENAQGPLNSVNDGTRPGDNVNINGGNDGTRIVPNVFIQPRQEVSQLPPIQVSDNTIHVGGSKPVDIPIKDKYPGMVDGLPNGIEEKDIKDILYKFHYTVGFHGHYEKGLKNGAKIGGYFVNGRDGISRIVTYVADENGYRPKFKFINLGLDSPDTPKEGTEKQFGLKSFEFVWYPIE